MKNVILAIMIVSGALDAATGWGTNGLSQTSSAEALGEGRIQASLQSAWYRQRDAFSGAPNAGAYIGTGLGAAAFGVNSWLDVFGTFSFYGSVDYDVEHKSGVGVTAAGAQASAPLPPDIPLRLAAQAAVRAGLSDNQINSNRVDGYDYFETRTQYDLVGRLLESAIFGADSQGLEVHFNQGLVKSMGLSGDNLLLFSGGLQFNIIPLVAVGLEINSRTYIRDRAFRTDPLWITPSVTLRTRTPFSFTLGGDISLSRERDTGPALRSLERARGFGAAVFSFDFLAKKRLAAAEKAQKDSLEKAKCLQDAKRLNALNNNLKRKVSLDSAAAMQQKRSKDSLQTVSDSLQYKSRQDSIALETALTEARRLLELEKERRSEMEKKLLSTGMLILDAVYFDLNKSEISMNSKPYLRLIGKMLERYPKLMLEVGGHTDNVGSAEKNQLLSQTRAESVRDFLLQAVPGLAGRLTAMGYGPSQPKADNKTKAGRKVNRRVELRVTNPEVLKDYN